MLLRALRDFNLGKLTADDTGIFMGLLNDIFPKTLESVPRAMNRDFEFQVSALPHLPLETLNPKPQTTPTPPLRSSTLNDMDLVGSVDIKADHQVSISFSKPQSESAFTWIFSSFGAIMVGFAHFHWHVIARWLIVAIHP